VDTSAYEKGHIKNVVGWNWTTQLHNNGRADIPNREEFEALCSGSGIANNRTAICTSDNNNWFAAFTFWQFKIYGHKDVRLMKGGCKKSEIKGQPFTTQAPDITATYCKASLPDASIPARRDEIF
jgi:thiosulfate/3-mercaptopyruvate sulfurtransferase